jgi:hypothetical protein
MRNSGISTVAALSGVLAVLCLARVASQESGPTDPSPYDVVEAWHKPFAKPGFAHGGNSGLFAESPDRIFVAQRGETRLPIPIPAEFIGFAGSVGINTLRATELRTWQLSIHHRQCRQRDGYLGSVGLPVCRFRRPWPPPGSH